MSVSRTVTVWPGSLLTHHLLSLADSAHVVQVFLEANGWHAQHERDVCVAYDQEHRSHGYDQVCPICSVQPRIWNRSAPPLASCIVPEVAGLQYLQPHSRLLKCPAPPSSAALHPLSMKISFSVATTKSQRVLCRAQSSKWRSWQPWQSWATWWCPGLHSFPTI